MRMILEDSLGFRRDVEAFDTISELRKVQKYKYPGHR